MICWRVDDWDSGRPASRCSASWWTVGRARPAADATLVASALWANLHGIAQLWGWGSLQLATGTTDFVALLDAALDAHLGPEER